VGFLLPACCEPNGLHRSVAISTAEKRQKLRSESTKIPRLDYTEAMNELVRDTVFAPFCGTGTDREDHDDGDLAVAPAKPQLKKPPLYRVILLNDDYTPMEFVVQVLEQFFGMGREKATQVMLAVHTQGKGVCGIYPQDIAETKASQVNQCARDSGHPLLCEVEPLSDDEED